MVAGLVGVVVLVVVIRHLMNEPPPPPPPPPPIPADLVQEEGPRVIEPDAERYTEVNDSTVIINIRRPGHRYETETVAQVSGDGYLKDWGLKGSGKFNLTWVLTSTGDVISNDGRTIVEERSFTFKEVVNYDAVSAGLELTEGQAWLVSSLVGGIVDLCAGTLGATTLGTKDWIDRVNGKQWEVPPEALRVLRGIDEYLELGGMLDVSKGLRLILPRPDFAMLDGKKVSLTFEDGKGIVRVEPIGCTLSDHEANVITRANALSDHYIFPNRAREVGASWYVRADNLGSMIDPRLRGVIIDTSVKLKRVNDSPDPSGGIVRNVSIDGPQRITVGSAADGKAVTGEVNLDEARFELSDKDGVVTKLGGFGTVDYRERSVDHLLFEMEMRVRPSFKVFGKTTVTKVR
ncbi:MAG: hypothetical protein FJ252_03815 [Phycisphaerae bacterium]|nr:hypothetical protein [Phycisphaerae bacterium]